MTVATSKQERTYSQLRSRIINGTYGPGHRLVIDAIARELDVSSIPVREAVRRLEAEGWVTYQKNHGAHVAPIDAHAWTEAVGTLAILEGYATMLAAPHLDERDFARLRALNQDMSDAIDALDVLAVSAFNQAFHQVVYDRCPNGHLRNELRTIQERLNTLRSTIFMFIPTRGRVSLDEHEQLLALVESGADPLEIEMAARTHKLRTVAAYERKLQETEEKTNDID
jgi:DNA-binding GntR family transcriptional regulator